MPKASPKSLIPIERIESKIYFLREEKVMLDSDLSVLNSPTAVAAVQPFYD